MQLVWECQHQQCPPIKLDSSMDSSKPVVFSHRMKQGKEADSTRSLAPQRGLRASPSDMGIVSRRLRAMQAVCTLLKLAPMSQVKRMRRGLGERACWTACQVCMKRMRVACKGIVRFLAQNWRNIPNTQTAIFRKCKIRRHLVLQARPHQILQLLLPN